MNMKLEQATSPQPLEVKNSQQSSKPSAGHQVLIPMGVARLGSGVTAECLPRVWLLLDEGLQGELGE